MVLLTKSIGIVTPLILSIVVVVAPRLISYTNQKRDNIVQQDRHEITLYGVQVNRLSRTWASMIGKEEKKMEQSDMSVW